MRMKDRFWRLLAACELLAREETAALAGRNFAALVRAQRVKSALLADLAAEAGPDCRDLNARARLQQLNAMPPDQRQRVLDRVESMERLTPTQRQQVTSTMGQLHALPPDRQRAVAQAFRNLRQLPPDQREAAAQSYARNFSPQERETLNNLLRAEPYLPVKRPPGYAPPPIQ